MEDEPHHGRRRIRRLDDMIERTYLSVDASSEAIRNRISDCSRGVTTVHLRTRKGV